MFYAHLYVDVEEKPLGRQNKDKSKGYVRQGVEGSDGGFDAGHPLPHPRWGRTFTRVCYEYHHRQSVFIAW